MQPNENMPKKKKTIEQDSSRTKADLYLFEKLIFIMYDELLKGLGQIYVHCWRKVI